MPLFNPIDMDDQQVNELASKFAEYRVPVSKILDKPEDRKIAESAAKDIIKWLLKTHCIISKATILTEYNRIITKDTIHWHINPVKSTDEDDDVTVEELIEYHNAYYTGLNIGRKDLLENLFDPKLFKKIQ